MPFYQLLHKDRSRFVLIGAGPACLTAGLELLARGCLSVTLLEQEKLVGGISKTVRHKGNAIDLGGHRFFSKSDEVMDWWASRLPLAESETQADALPNAFLVRSRLSRILYERKFFDYPVTLSLTTLRLLGPLRLVKIGFSFLLARLHPVCPEKTLQDFFINRFGGELYRTFFRDYTEKVWGRPCSGISSDWGAQRVKGLSVTGLLSHAVKSLVSRLLGRHDSLAQKNVETSLISRFLYPKYGPGSLWEQAASDIESRGGKVLLETEVTGLELADDGRSVTGLHVRQADGTETFLPADAVISSMPLQALVASARGPVPEDVREVAKGLVYRDFMTVGMVLRNPQPGSRLHGLKDNWIYVQEPDVRMGRIQIFNNWSPWLAADSATLLLGLEYFCTEGDALWTMEDAEFIRMAKGELSRIGMADPEDVLDAFVVRVPKAYPAYFGSYDRIAVLQNWLNSLTNLFPVGRNGMHRYNNMDHSMLSALRTVDCLLTGSPAKEAIWQVNAEKEYHETKQGTLKA